jgi:hypothetical protein
VFRSTFAALAALTLFSPLQPSALVSDPDAFMRRLRVAVLLDYELQAGYTYLEQRRDVKLSKLGKVMVGPPRTFEVFPSEKPGGTYKRLIAVDGKPLDPEELAKRAEEHRRDLREAAERERAETPAQRARREQEQQDERREREAILDDALAVFEPALAGRETIDGRPVLAVDLSPRADARVTTRHGRWMKAFEGRMWVGESDYQIARLDMRAREDVTIGWGIIGRVHEGSRVVFTRKWIDDRWLPAAAHYEVSGRTLLFRKFQFATTTTYSNYVRLPARDRPEPVPADSELPSDLQTIDDRLHAVRVPRQLERALFFGR